MRRRITALAALIAAVVLLSVAVVVVSAVRSELYDNLDRSLDQRAADLASSFGAGGDRELVSSDLEDHFALILDADGGVLASTANVAAVDERWPLPDTGTIVVDRDDLPIEDDVYRVLVRADSIDGVGGYVVVGENVDDLRDTVRELLIALAIVVPSALVVLAAAVWWLVGRTLRPVEDIRRNVDEIGLAELGRRVPAAGTGDEVDDLARTMNRMLARLEASADRQRQFVADASHELRTPLTRLRTALEVELAHPSDDSIGTVRSAADDVVRMQHLVDGLLFLARVDAAAAPIRTEPVDLDVIVADEVAAIDPPAAVHVDLSRVEPVELRGDPAQLARLVRNLLVNAVRHARSIVAVEVVEQATGVEMSVNDDGPGIAGADRERIFERFVRLDDSRSGRDGGAGLGLAIVSEIVAAHDGSVVVGDSELGGARFTVRLPLGRAPSN